MSQLAPPRPAGPPTPEQADPSGLEARHPGATDNEKDCGLAGVAEVRGVGDTVVMCPPLVSTEADIMAMTSRFLDGYQDALTKA